VKGFGKIYLQGKVLDDEGARFMSVAWDVVSAQEQQFFGTGREGGGK